MSNFINTQEVDWCLCAESSHQRNWWVHTSLIRVGMTHASWAAVWRRLTAECRRTLHPKPAVTVSRTTVVSNTHTHNTTVLLLFWNMSGTTQVSRYQKGKTRKVKTNLHLLEQEILSGSGICWAICKSAPHPRQPRQHPITQFFTGWMPFLPPKQQRQSTEGNIVVLRVACRKWWSQLFVEVAWIQ